MKTKSKSEIKENPTDDDDLEGQDDRLVNVARRREKRRLRSERAYWISTKLHALCWVLSAIVSFIVSDSYKVFIEALQGQKVNVLAFNIGCLFFLVLLGGLLRIMILLKPDESDFEQVHSQFILGTTLSGVMSFIFLSIGLWPVYRIFAPLLLILYWFGAIMSLHFLP
jgi:Na+/glutamate symporter